MLAAALLLLRRVRAAPAGARETHRCGGGRPAVCHARRLAAVPRRASAGGAADRLRLLGQLLCADPQWGAVRPVSLRRPGVSAAAWPTQGLAAPDSLFTYAVGRLVVWVPAQSPLDVARLQMKVFEDPSVKHVAIANPAARALWAGGRSGAPPFRSVRCHRGQAGAWREYRADPAVRAERRGGRRESSRSRWRSRPRSGRRGAIGRFLWMHIRAWSRAASF